MKIEKLAGIDIGSNAIRLLITNVLTESEDSIPLFRKSAIVRVPIRLGADTFLKKEISEENKNRMVKAMEAFKLLMDVHGVSKYKACATSAMREAINGKDVVKEIYKKTTVNIEIIDGKKEASIIFATDLKHIIQPGKSYVYVDVGGGSTEITIFSHGKIVSSKSFKIGTVRLLNKKHSFKKIWEEIEIYIKENTKHFKNVSLIGSGGNINKVFKMSEKPIGSALTINYIQQQYDFLNTLSYEQRISELGLNPDRADVIIPATRIYLNAMLWSGAKKIYVPKIGLADGIIKTLYFNEF